MKKTLSIFIIMTMVISMFSAFALTSEATRSGSFEYEIRNATGTLPRGARITRYWGDNSQVTIPATIDGLKVVQIDPYVFQYHTSVRDILIPQYVDTIRANAFSGCTNLGRVRISHSVKSISPTAFDYTDFRIVGCAGSYAETYANSKGIYFATFDCVACDFVQGECTCCGDLLGDVNDDGVVNERDLMQLQRFLAGWDGITINADHADMNRDGLVDELDSLMLARLLAGWDIWN